MIRLIAMEKGFALNEYEICPVGETKQKGRFCALHDGFCVSSFSRLLLCVCLCVLLHCSIADIDQSDASFIVCAKKSEGDPTTVTSEEEMCDSLSLHTITKPHHNSSFSQSIIVCRFVLLGMEYRKPEERNL
jgi:hypothetical protein